jgi:hypothetical protein
MDQGRTEEATPEEPTPLTLGGINLTALLGSLMEAIPEHGELQIRLSKTECSIRHIVDEDPSLGPSAEDKFHTLQYKCHDCRCIAYHGQACKYGAGPVTLQQV